MQSAFDRWIDYFSGNQDHVRRELTSAAQDASELVHHPERLGNSIPCEKREAFAVAMEAVQVARMNELAGSNLLASDHAEALAGVMLGLEKYPASAFLFVNRKGALIEHTVTCCGRPITLTKLADELKQQYIRLKASGVVYAHSYYREMPKEYLEPLTDANRAFQYLKSYGVVLLDYVLVSKDKTVSLMRKWNE